MGVGCGCGCGGGDAVDTLLVAQLLARHAPRSLPCGATRSSKPSIWRAAQEFVGASGRVTTVVLRGWLLLSLWLPASKELVVAVAAVVDGTELTTRKQSEGRQCVKTLTAIVSVRSRSSPHPQHAETTTLRSTNQYISFERSLKHCHSRSQAAVISV